MFYEQVCKDDSPKGLWLLPETATTSADSSGNAQNGSIKGGPLTAAAGPIPELGAVTLNGTNQWISVPDSATVDFGDVVTYEAWVKRGTTGTGQTILDKGGGSLIVRFLTNNKLLVRRNGVANICESTVALSDTSSWHHIVVTKNGATVRIYIDGVNVTGTVTNSTLVNTSEVLSIGSADGGLEEFWNGSLAGVAVYATALSAERVVAHLDAGIRRLAMVI